MQVILMEKVANLGNLGDVVKVKDGFARNFLIPQGKAKRATDANLKAFEARRTELEKTQAETLAKAQEHGARLEGFTVQISQKAGVDGRLFGSREVQDLIQAEHDKVNGKFARAEQVKAFRLLETQLSAEYEELTPTLILKRSLVQKKYADLIDSMYHGAGRRSTQGDSDEYALPAIAALALAAPLAQATQGVSKNEIVLGSIQDLSGPIAGFGKQLRMGMQLRVDEVNEQGGIQGRKLKLIFEDSAYDPRKAVLGAQKLA